MIQGHLLLEKRGIMRVLFRLQWTEGRHIHDEMHNIVVTSKLHNGFIGIGSYRDFQGEGYLGLNGAIDSLIM